ncbi:hypothetical protein GGR56DRAFT_114400 [Xylariaceae sp. FL0804]|nr:hypothetical protein GGR56DRAFT_114400 [Xylariaceae sp. FL0804]
MISSSLSARASHRVRAASSSAVPRDPYGAHRNSSPRYLNLSTGADVILEARPLLGPICAEIRGHAAAAAAPATNSMPPSSCLNPTARSGRVQKRSTCLRLGDSPGTCRIDVNPSASTRSIVPSRSVYLYIWAAILPRAQVLSHLAVSAWPCLPRTLGRHGPRHPESRRLSHPRTASPGRTINHTIDHGYSRNPQTVSAASCFHPIVDHTSLLFYSALDWHRPLD